jgi:DNA-directed RNA polymerase specialized sigma24 family protein
MEYIHDKTARKILYLRLVDGDTIGEIAGKVRLDPKTVWSKIHEGERELFSHLPG